MSETRIDKDVLCHIICSEKVINSRKLFTNIYKILVYSIFLHEHIIRKIYINLGDFSQNIAEWKKTGD